MTVDIAQKNLNKGVEVTVQIYLGDMTFEKAAVWMDEIRSDHSYDYLKNIALCAKTQIISFLAEQG